MKGLKQATWGGSRKYVTIYYAILYIVCVGIFLKLAPSDLTWFNFFLGAILLHSVFMLFYLFSLLIEHVYDI